MPLKPEELIPFGNSKPASSSCRKLADDLWQCNFDADEIKRICQAYHVGGKRAAYEAFGNANALDADLKEILERL